MTADPLTTEARKWIADVRYRYRTTPSVPALKLADAAEALADALAASEQARQDAETALRRYEQYVRRDLYCDGMTNEGVELAIRALNEGVSDLAAAGSGDSQETQR